MKVWLADKDKCSMLFLSDGLNFTYDVPGPIEVDFDSLSIEGKTQLYVSWKRGVLKVDNEDDLKSFFQSKAPSQVSQPVQPIQTFPKVDSFLKEREAKLKNLLRKKIDIIKKTIPSLSIVELQSMIELEKNGKNRQKLLGLIDQFVAKGLQTVKESVGQEDIGGSIFNPSSQPLDNSLDVVESEQEDVVLLP